MTEKKRLIAGVLAVAFDDEGNLLLTQRNAPSTPYEDSLVVTEAAPLVAYVLSTPVSKLITGEKLTQFNCLVEQELASHEAIHITKSTGLFEAS